MITTKDNLDVLNVDSNGAYAVKLGDSIKRIKSMNNAVAEKCDKLVAAAEISYSDDKKDLLINMSKNRKLIPKCLSLMILHSWFRVTFIHWIHWRILHRRYSMSEMSEAVKECMGLSDVSPFYSVLAALQGSSRMIQKMSETNTFNIAREYGRQESTK